MKTSRISLLSLSCLLFICCLQFLRAEDWVWKFQRSGLFESSPAIAPDGTVYVGCDDGRIYAVQIG